LTAAAAAAFLKEASNEIVDLKGTSVQEILPKITPKKIKQRPPKLTGKQNWHNPNNASSIASIQARA
jgi:hypothetical protein